jgi:hypothetical protein
MPIRGRPLLCVATPRAMGKAGQRLSSCMTPDFGRRRRYMKRAGVLRKCLKTPQGWRDRMNRVRSCASVKEG